MPSTFCVGARFHSATSALTANEAYPREETTIEAMVPGTLGITKPTRRPTTNRHRTGPEGLPGAAQGRSGVWSGQRAAPILGVMDEGVVWLALSTGGVLVPASLVIAHVLLRRAWQDR